MDKGLDNRRLIKLLLEFRSEFSNERYGQVVNVLMTEEVYLLLPSIHDNTVTGQWKNLSSGSLKLTSVFNLDGLKVLAAFTSEQALFAWANQETLYTAMLAKNVLELCQHNGIDRIVIDSHQPTMFVLERNQGNIQHETIPLNTPLRIGTPADPIRGALLEKLRKNFDEVISIDGAYQYVMSRGNEHSLIIAFTLSVNSDNARKATINAVQKAFEGEKVSLPIDVHFIESQEDYERIRQVANSVMYIRG